MLSRYIVTYGQRIPERRDKCASRTDAIQCALDLRGEYAIVSIWQLGRHDDGAPFYQRLGDFGAVEEYAELRAPRWFSRMKGGNDNG